MQRRRGLFAVTAVGVSALLIALTVALSAPGAGGAPTTDPARQPARFVTRCTYSHPQIASVGMSEKQAKEKGREVKIGKFPFSALGRAIIHGEPGGFVKLVADAKTGQLLGAHIVGPNATELIAEPALTQLFQGDAWEMGRNIHPHPTLSEAVMEAALAVDGHAIHI